MGGRTGFSAFAEDMSSLEAGVNLQIINEQGLLTNKDPRLTGLMWQRCNVWSLLLDDATKVCIYVR